MIFKEITFPSVAIPTLSILPTVMSGVPLKLNAVDAVPVKSPTNPWREVVTPPTVRFDIDVIPRVAIPVLFKLMLVNEVIIPEDAVIIPEMLILCGNIELFKVPLVILVALSPCKFVPNPVNEYAVKIPETLISWGNLSLSSVPDVITDAFKSVTPSPGPLNLIAVIIPVVFTFPVSASTDNPFPMRGSIPTCKE